MRSHWIQHVPFESLGYLRPLLAAHSHHISATRAWEAADYPDPRDLDLLVVMGGPMSVYDEDAHPWLPAEKEFLREALGTRCRILGICLGAQLLAEALGARIHPADRPEIGWFPVECTASGAVDRVGRILGRSPQVFHWHGETFDLPDDATALASSEACPNQAFRWGKRVLGLQFHLEMTPEGAERLIENCPQDLEREGPFVHSAAEILSRPDRFLQAHEVLDTLWEAFLSDD